MNKKLFFILTIIHLNIFCISAQIYPVRPQLSDKHSFSMILLPDPQSYNKFDANQPLFELQTAWVANSIEPLNIKGVLCTGDLVEQNEIRIPDGINGNQTSQACVVFHARFSVSKKSFLPAEAIFRAFTKH